MTKHIQAGQDIHYFEAITPPLIQVPLVPQLALKQMRFVFVATLELPLSVLLLMAITVGSTITLRLHSINSPTYKHT